METLEKSRVCRLCGKKCQISIDIFDKNENHVRKINAILPILVHEIDFLPKQMCHRCSYKLEEFYNFYIECAKIDSDLKSQLSWMKRDTSKEQIIIPMVKMNPFKIKTEPPDCKDSDSNDVFDHVSSFGSFDTPILTCSRCRCLCDRNIKVNKSPITVKTFLKGSENQPQYTNASNNSCNNSGVSSESENIGVNLQIKGLKNEYSKELLNAKQECIHKIPVVVIDNSDCNLFKDFNNLKNRALRPRKDSVDYIGPKKNKNRLQKQFRNKEDIFDSKLVKTEQVLVTLNNSLHPSPVIKLEKVDITLKSLKTRKNLEEFNKRVKELEYSRRLNRDEDFNKKMLRRLKVRSRKNFYKEECQTKKDLCKEKKLKRKSLQCQSQIGESFFNKSNIILQSQENQTKKTIDESQNKKVLQKEIKQNEQYLQNENDCCNKILVLDNNVNDQPYAINDTTMQKSKTKNFVFQVKQEIDNTVVENSNIKEEQKQSCDIDLTKNEKLKKLINRLPMFPIVKLEKDYTCNVDYPKIKIKRHLAVIDLEKSVNGVLDISVEGETNLQDEVAKKSLKSEQNSELKSFKKKEKKFKSMNSAGKDGKVSKKKCKLVNLINLKKQVLTKQGMSNTIPQNEFKYFCEECDICFKNKELFKLHPCYQN